MDIKDEVYKFLEDNIILPGGVSGRELFNKMDTQERLKTIHTYIVYQHFITQRERMKEVLN